MKIDCLCAGILVADHLSPPLDRLPRAGELILADALPLEIGGCASNVALDLIRYGLSVGVLGCVGQDAFGRFIIDTLAQGGIDTSGLREIAGVPTSGTLILNVRGEDRRFIHTIGANGHLRAEDISLDQIRQAKVFYVGGYLLLDSCDPERLAELFRAARVAGVQTVLDIVLPGAGDHWPRLAPVLPETDVFLPNFDEALAITGLDDPMCQAERFVAAGARTAVITCGGDGTVLVSQTNRLRAGVYPVEFLGGTGAGDAFDAGYIAGLVAGGDERECLRLGSLLGASCVRGLSATASVFTRAEAAEFAVRYPLAIETI
ncbi:MAG: carbohydrate kinase family protein [Pirellulales bacterium]|nr:carbohydrate kinase family protein [Pirellulales bacterium]